MSNTQVALIYVNNARWHLMVKHKINYLMEAFEIRLELNVRVKQL